MIQLTGIIICFPLYCLAYYFFGKSGIAYSGLLSSVYALVLFPTVYFVGKELDREKLIAGLSQRWVNSLELADYMIKYWVAIKYPASAGDRQGSIFIALFGTLLSAYCAFTLQGSSWLFYLLLLTGAIHLHMVTIVNRPVTNFNAGLNHEPSLDFLLASQSIIASSELFPNDSLRRLMADNVMANPKSKAAIEIVLK